MTCREFVQEVLLNIDLDTEIKFILCPEIPLNYDPDSEIENKNWSQLYIMPHGEGDYPCIFKDGEIILSLYDFLNIKLTGG